MLGPERAGHTEVVNSQPVQNLCQNAGCACGMLWRLFKALTRRKRCSQLLRLCLELWMLATWLMSLMCFGTWTKLEPLQSDNVRGIPETNSSRAGSNLSSNLKLWLIKLERRNGRNVQTSWNRNSQNIWGCRWDVLLCFDFTSLWHSAVSLRCIRANASWKCQVVRKDLDKSTSRRLAN